MYRNYGKIDTCVIYGDSISTTHFSEGGFQKLLQDHLGIKTMINHAISASGTAKGTPNSVIELLDEAENIHENADLVIVWSGTNDWHWNVPVGDITNFNTETYCGAIRKVITKLSTVSPKANIIALTPIVRFSAPDGMTIEGDAYNYKNSVGATLNDYYDALVDVTANVGCALCDMRRLSGFNMSNRHIFLRDNVHPSRHGYLRIAEIIAAFCDSLSFVENDKKH